MTNLEESIKEYQMKKVLITGFGGQDAGYLAQWLIQKDYEVYGMMRNVSHANLDFVVELGLEKVKIVEGDLTDSNSLYKLISSIQPDELYNLASMSHVGTSFSQPELSANVTGSGVIRLLDQIHLHSSHTRFYQASSSEMFGDSVGPHSEITPFKPRSPYASAKVFAHNICKVYRESYGLYIACGILMNHESPRRGKMFLTKKVTDYVGRLVNNKVDTPLRLGCLDAARDWGSARDYIQAMWLMLQQDKPDDYLIGTGIAHTVRDFCNAAFKSAGIDLTWRGQGVNEYATDASGRVLIQVDPIFYRPAEVPHLQGDMTKARNVLHWSPTTTFDELVKWMVEYDINLYK